MRKWFKSECFDTPAELAKFVSGQLNIEVSQICFTNYKCWVLFYWTW